MGTEGAKKNTPNINAFTNTEETVGLRAWHGVRALTSQPQASFLKEHEQNKEYTLLLLLWPSYIYGDSNGSDQSVLSVIRCKSE